MNKTAVVAFGGNVSIGATGIVNGNVRSLGGNISTDPGATVPHVAPNVSACDLWLS